MSSLIGLDGTQLLKPVVALAGWTFVQEVNLNFPSHFYLNSHD